MLFDEEQEAMNSAPAVCKQDHAKRERKATEFDRLDKEMGGTRCQRRKA
jgi:hypothetical protein